MLCNNYWSRNLIGSYHFWVISPRNSTLFTLFTRPFLAGRCVQAGHETSFIPAYCTFVVVWILNSQSLDLRLCGYVRGVLYGVSSTVYLKKVLWDRNVAIVWWCFVHSKIAPTLCSQIPSSAYCTYYAPFVSRFLTKDTVHTSPS